MPITTTEQPGRARAACRARHITHNGHLSSYLTSLPLPAVLYTCGSSSYLNTVVVSVSLVVWLVACQVVACSAVVFPCVCRRYVWPQLNFKIVLFIRCFLLLVDQGCVNPSAGCKSKHQVSAQMAMPVSSSLRKGERTMFQ